MTKNQEKLISEIEKIVEVGLVELSEEALAGLEEFKMVPVAPKFTEKGKIVLKYMQENYETYNNVFQAKIIGEAIGIPGRSVSGSMKKLVTDGYVEKMSQNPISYKLTESGIAEQVD